jgi:hypothetical protein
LLTVNAGVAISFDGHLTNTSSGIQSNPTSADTSSKGCLITINGTASSRASLTNSVGSLIVNNIWTIYLNYGAIIADYCDFSHAYATQFALFNVNSANTNNANRINNCSFSPFGATNVLIFTASTTFNMALDIRFNTYNPGSVAMWVFGGGSIALSAGAYCDWSSSATGTGTGSVQYPWPKVTNAVYGGQCIIAYSDIRSVHKPVSVI